MSQEAPVKSKYDEFVDIIQANDDEFGKDLEKFFSKGQNAAGKRIRSKAQELIVWLKQLRKDVSTEKQQRKAAKVTT